MNKGTYPASGIDALSGREREVVEMATAGNTDNAICRRLGIQPGTLGTYWARIRTKTGLGSRPELAAAFSKNTYQTKMVNTIGLVAERSVTYGASRATMATEVFDALPLACLVSDLGGRIVAVNDAAAQLFGPGADEFVWPETPAGPLVLSSLVPGEIVRFPFVGAKTCECSAKRIGQDSQLVLVVAEVVEARHAVVMLP